MLAIVAAVLFGIAFLFQLAGFSLAPLDSTLLLLLGLTFLALHAAGVGSRTAGNRRARR